MKKKLVLIPIFLILMSVYILAVDVYTPSWVQMDCTVANSDVPEKTTSFAYQDGQYTTIDCNEFTKTCKIYIRIPSTLQSKFTEVLCPAEIDIYRCTAQNVCSPITSSTLFYDMDWEIATLNPAEYVKVNIADVSGLLCGTRTALSGIVVNKVFDNYGLVIMGNTRLVKREGTCSFTTSELHNVKGILPYGNRLVFDSIGEGISYVSYINDWVKAYSGNLYTYKSYGQVFCTGFGSVFKTQEVTLADGTKAIFKAGEPIYDSDIECCPQQQGCSLDFKWTNQPGACTVTAECSGAGYYSCESNKVAKKYSCINNQCVQSTISGLACACPGDCPGGYCDVSSVDPTKWTCKSGTPPETYCGDGICDTLVETGSSCPQDCNNPIPDDNFWLYIVIGAIILLLVILIIVAATNKKGGAF